MMLDCSSPALSHQQSWQSADEDHAFIAPGQGDVRSPCPALNTLANHGYINRTGKSISPSSLESALRSVYHLSAPLANSLVTAGMICCESVGISLNYLAAHNRIEHDASLVHDNAPPGAKFAPTEVNQSLLEDLLGQYPDGMSLSDLAEARFRREMLLQKEGRSKLNGFHEEIGHGEAAMTWLIMKEETDIVSTQTIREWLGGETFPDAYVIPDTEISLEKVVETSQEIRKMMEML